MPVIRITDSTWERLKKWAIPLEDSPEDAVRKVLDAAEELLRHKDTSMTQRKPTASLEKHEAKLRRGKKTPQMAYRFPILEVLEEIGGTGRVGEVLDRVEIKMKSYLNTYDYEKLPSGIDIRWRNTAMWERFEMVKDGLLKPDSSPGIWELSEKGRGTIRNRS